MAIKVIDDSILQGIAEAIQAKDGGGKMTVDEMLDRIENIILYTNNGKAYTKNMVFSDTVTTLETNAYSNCPLLETVTLPNSITSIGADCFRYCSNLMIIDLIDYDDPQNIPILQNISAFAYTSSNIKMVVTNQEMYDAFTTATNWSSYASRFRIKPSGTNQITQAKDTIGGTALYNGSGYKQDYRWDQNNIDDNGVIAGIPNKFSVGYIELEPGDVVHFYGDILKGTSGGLTMHIQSSSNTRLVRASFSNWADYTNRSDIMAYMTDIDYDTTTNTLHSFKWTGGTNAVKGYMHLSCVGIFAENVTVVTINEE